MSQIDEITDDHNEKEFSLARTWSTTSLNTI